MVDRHGLWPVAHRILVSRVDLDPGTLIPSTWVFDPLMPFEVVAWFGTEDEGVEWTFSREMLVEGLDGPAGVGDVRLRPSRTRVLLQLSGINDHGGEERATFGMSRASLRAFLGVTFALVPAGCEDVDLDEVVAQLLAGGAR